MGTLPRRLYAPTVSAFVAAGLGRVSKSVAADITPPAVLTYPVPDLQGDVLEPAGLSLWDFENVYGRLSNFEHGPYIGTTQVEFKSMPRLDKAGKPDESLGYIGLPVGVTTFFESAADAARHTLRKFDHAGNVVGAYDPDDCARLADHLRPLVPAVYGGVSLEFRPDGPEGVAYKSLGDHPNLRGRPAYHFYKSRMVGLASACDIPVNQFAGYVPADPETLERAEKALRYCERADGLDVIRKSLKPLTGLLKSTPSGRVTAPVRRDPTMSAKTAPKRLAKAYDPMADDDTSTDPMLNADAAEGMAGTSPDQVQDDAATDMKPTPAALFQFAQALKDACLMADDMGSRGEHVQGVKALKKFCEQIEAIADKVAAMADKVAAAVDTGDAAELDMEADAEPVETDEDGGLLTKSLTATKWRPRRFVKASPYTLKHLKAAKAAKPADDEKKQLEQHLAWALDRIDELEGKRAN